MGGWGVVTRTDVDGPGTKLWITWQPRLFVKSFKRVFLSKDVPSRSSIPEVNTFNVDTGCL